ncbi:leucine--tRNA ligase [Marinoscillum sp.]|uniref:leucine--tRNA ligase n=1 Tax=Marinoscillum sp. TaxID=2024838 RepID=UPI003BA845C7
MAEYKHQEVEKKWQQYWEENQTYKVSNDSSKPKYYVLDMFPYPSGAGLHVGHPLGYIASDIVSRFKRLKGFNVLHPMGFDSFGLPAEQYAIQTGQHPAITTETNIARYKEQLTNLGFSYDWSREVRTSDPSYYKWTQWIFKQLFNSWYNKEADKAEHIDTLIAVFAKDGNATVNAVCDEDTPAFSAEDWNSWSEEEQQKMLLKYRLTFIAETTVNWCPALGTVLSNDEVKDGFSERGGHPVIKKTMPQWSMRITAYADRLSEDLDKVDWPEPIKDMQRNWIGKSFGAEVDFKVLSPNPSPEERGLAEAWKTGNPKMAKTLIEYARNNRKNPTDQEDALWQKLRNKQLGYKVRRQHPIDDFIVDFVFLREKLIIEVDGGYHDTEEQKEFDAARKELLEYLGFEVMVIRNEEVDENIEKVIHRIKDRLIKIDSTSPSLEEKGSGDEVKKITVFTTRIDTIYGVTFMVLAPEADIVKEITTDEQRAEVEAYVEVAKNRSERERMSDVKTVSGVFTGSYVLNPFSGEKVPVYIADYVLAGYGTGAVMAVPSGDQRDFDFAKHFDLPIVQVIDQQNITDTEADPTKEGKMVNSGILDGLSPLDAIQKANEYIVEKGLGTPKVNYRMRDAIFGRQRYWGEPIPVYFKNGVPYLLEDDELPLELPEVDKYLPTEDGEPPLGRAEDWKTADGAPYELTTMPGWAGSSWYFFRYMDPNNDREFASKEALDYWQQVDFYLGGSEHATGHLLYSRFWTKFLYDLGFIKVDEYAKKLVNQGMITGTSMFICETIYSTTEGTKKFISSEKDYKNRDSEAKILAKYDQGDLANVFRQSRIDISAVNEVKVGDNKFEYHLDFDKLKKLMPHFAEYEVLDEIVLCKPESEKMSKSKYNVVNPDDLVEKYGADTLRMYEMFLGPIEQSKPWNTNGIEGVYKFLRKFWGLFHDKSDNFDVSDEKATKDEMKVLHGLIKKIEEDVDRLSLNTSVSNFMIAVNELQALKCNKKEVLEPMTIALAPYAPHLAEELWHALGNESTVCDATFPAFDANYLVEDTIEYPIMVNGKMRAKLQLGADLNPKEIEEQALAHENVQKWTEGKAPKKVIVVPKKIVNVVV